MAEKISFEYLEKEGKEYPLIETGDNFTTIINGQEQIFANLSEVKDGGFEVKKGYNRGYLLGDNGNLNVQNGKNIQI